jgi:hypothetical protein
VASNGPTAAYVETTDTAGGNPLANYAVFRDQTSPSFDVKTVVGAGQTTMGIYGVQIVENTRIPYATWSTANAGGQPPDGDFDRDGMPNGVEYFIGASGSSFTSNPGIIGRTVTWPRSPSANATYVVQVSTALTAEGQPGGWVTATTGVVDNGTSVSYMLPSGAPRSFVRLKVSIP